MKNGNDIKHPPAERAGNEVIVFKPSTSTNEFKIVLDETNETVWASEQQIANLFSKDRSVISKHIKKITTNRLKKSFWAKALLRQGFNNPSLKAGVTMKHAY